MKVLILIRQLNDMEPQIQTIITPSINYCDEDTDIEEYLQSLAVEEIIKVKKEVPEFVLARFYVRFADI